MTSGVRKRGVLLALLLSTAVQAAGDREALNGLTAVMAQLARTREREGRVAFVEQKTMAALDTPLRQTGVLIYRAPDLVVREIREPVAETWTVDGDELRVTRSGKEEVSRLSRIPGLKAFVESFRATLAGDLPSLQHYYRVEFAGDVTAWRLRLEPRDRSLARAVVSIHFTGHQGRVDTIRIDDANGDHSEMSLSPLDPSAD